VPAPHPLAAALAGRSLTLASGSPRRRELLDRLGLPFAVDAPDVDETPAPGEAAHALVRRLAVAKARAVAARQPARAVVVGADTVVVVDGDVLGKPADEAGARAMLRRLAGRTHQVVTGVAVIVDDGAAAATIVTTDVTFADLDDDEIDWYVATGEPLDKAGAYALQGGGAALVTRVDGSASSVVGLPLAELTELLARELGGFRPISGTPAAQIAGWDESRPDCR